MKRILLVDDDPDILESLRMILEETYEVEVAKNGAEALARLEQGAFDAIVLDLMMPVLDGAAVMRELAARRITTPVVLASAARDLDAVAADLQAADHLGKPFEVSALEAALARLLGGAGSGDRTPT